MKLGSISKTDGGWSFDGQIKDTISHFERDQNDYLYDIEPQSQNLFFIANFSESTSDEGLDSLKELYNAHMRARSIELPRLSYEFETDPITKMPIFKSGKFNYEITISWFEDVYHSIYQYHENWMHRWFDYQYNTLRCGKSGKFRKCQLVAYHYKRTGDVFESKAEPEPLYIINMYGLVPRELPPLKHSYSEDQGDSELQISYYCSKFEILFNSAFTKTSDSLYDTTEKATSGDQLSDKVWGPTVSSNSGNDTMTYEKLRITRALSQRYGASMIENV